MSDVDKRFRPERGDVIEGAPDRPRAAWLRPRTVVALGAVAAIVAGTLSGLASSGHGPTDPSQPAPPDFLLPHRTGWQRLPDPPLSPRWDAVGAFVAGKVLVLGGTDATYDGPAEPVLLPHTFRDGAALDPQTGRWTPIADAPWPPSTAAAHVVAGDRLLLARNGPGTWLLYDADADAWRNVPEPPHEVPQPRITADGDQVYVLDEYPGEAPGPVQVLDLSTHQWSSLPDSPYPSLLDERTLLATDAGVVVMGDGLVPRPPGRQRPPALAEVWDGHTWTRYQSPDAAGTDWYWTGQRVISTYRATRHDAAHGRPGDFKQAAAFDPATGSWSHLPWLPPDDPSGRSPAPVLLEDSFPFGSGSRLVSEGYLYDDATGTSQPIPAPSQWSRQARVFTGDAIVLVGGSQPVFPTHRGSLVDQGGQTLLDITNHAWLLQVN